MGHYAKIVDGKVENVIVAKADFFETYIDDTPGDWVKTSYNTRGGIHYQPNSDNPSDDQSKALRKNYGAKGMNYDGIGFFGDQPFPSWTLNSDTYWWMPPIDYPTIKNDGADPVVWYYLSKWNETAYQQDNTKGWKATKHNLDGTPHADAGKVYDWNGTNWVPEA